MPKLMMCDPPSGHRWGFPKACPEECQPKHGYEAFLKWLKSEGWKGKESDLEHCGFYWTEED